MCVCVCGVVGAHSCFSSLFAVGRLYIKGLCGMRALKHTFWNNIQHHSASTQFIRTI